MLLLKFIIATCNVILIKHYSILQRLVYNLEGYFAFFIRVIRKKKNGNGSLFFVGELLVRYGGKGNL